MFIRMLIDSLARRRSRKILAALAIWIGLSLVVGMLTLSLDVGDKMSQELRAFGANIRVEPVAASVPVRVGGYELAPAAGQTFLQEGDLASLKRIFWRNNILGIVARLWTTGRISGRETPLLGVWFAHSIPVEDAEPFTTGVRQVYGHWKLAGRWPAGPRECLVGEQQARRLGVTPGDTLEVAAPAGTVALRVSGIATTGGPEDDAIIAPLEIVQALSGLQGRVSEADVSALTTPENALAEKYRLDPESLTPAEYERWACTPYPGSVAAEIQKAIPESVARVVRRVSRTEGAVLTRIGGLMSLLAILTLMACCLSVAGVLAAAVLERRSEVALLRAIGAHLGDVWWLFLSEAGVLGMAGGVLAAATGPLLGQWLVSTVFGSRAETHLAPALLAPLLGLLIAWVANLWPVWRTLNQNTAQVLHGN